MTEPSPDAPSDRSLVARLRGGRQDAAAQLYLRYARRLRALAAARCSPLLARRVEPDDIVQSVFRRFFGRVSGGDYDVPPGEELWGLLLVIALNKIRTEEVFHRADKRDARREAGPPLPASREAAASGEEAHLRACVEEALGRLPEGQRVVVELRVEGHDVGEVARRVGRSKRTVERALQEARSRLGALLGSG
jgi:RNA polymerase sigma-70 factor, ECF subfamily